MIYMCGERVSVGSGLVTTIYVRYKLEGNSVRRCNEIYMSSVGVFKYLKKRNTTDVQTISNYIKKIGLKGYIIDYVDMGKYVECSRELYKLEDVMCLREKMWCV